MLSENKLTMKNVRKFDTIKAIYSPAEEHIHTLREEFFQYIGEELILYCCWIGHHDDPFPGQKIFAGAGDDIDRITRWIPECDLELVEIIKE